MYMCLGLPTWDWITYQRTFQEQTDSLSQKSDTVYSFSLQAGPCVISPIHIGMSASIVIFQVLFRHPYCQDFMGMAQS